MGFGPKEAGYQPPSIFIGSKEIRGIHGVPQSVWLYPGQEFIGLAGFPVVPQKTLSARTFVSKFTDIDSFSFS